MRTPREIINDLALRLGQFDPHASDIDASIRFDVTGEHGGSWLLQLNNTRRVVALHASDPPPVVDCTFRTNSPDFVSLFEGRLTGQQLFFDGRLEVDGDLTVTLKLPAITRLLRGAGV